MPRTIIQSIGPLYGEAVNGTVFGRPNGSVYVPPSNKIVLIDNNAGIIGKNVNNQNLQLDQRIGLIADSQDSSSYIRTGVFTDSDCTTLFGNANNLPAGNFNYPAVLTVGYNATAPTTGTTYYVRAFLINNGEIVAVSDVLEVEGA